MARRDDRTMELPGVAKRRGRRPTGKAKTGAQRQKEYRKRRALVPAGEAMPATIKRLADQFDLSSAQVTRELLRFALCNRDWSRLGFPSLVTEITGESE